VLRELRSAGTQEGAIERMQTREASDRLLGQVKSMAVADAWVMRQRKGG